MSVPFIEIFAQETPNPLTCVIPVSNRMTLGYKDTSTATKLKAFWVCVKYITINGM